MRPRESAAKRQGYVRDAWKRLVAVYEDTDADPAQNSGDEHLYCTQDANFNVTALVDDYDGAVVERYMYSPYGEVSVLHGVRDSSGTDTSADEWDPPDAADSFANEILYCGYRFDNETGLYHVRHRYYHPPLGRWLSRDPIGYADGMGLYEYVRSNATAHKDPFGLQVPDFFGAGRAAQRGAMYHEAGYPTPEERRQYESGYTGPRPNGTFAKGAAWVETIRKHLPRKETCLTLPSITLLIVPYPGGSFDVKFGMGVCVQECCDTSEWRIRKQADIKAVVTFEAKVGYEVDLSGEGPRFSGPSLEVTRSGSAMPVCKPGLKGEVTIEVGGKVSAAVYARIFANVTFSTHEPMVFDYGAAAGVEVSAGAKIYVKAEGKATGSLVFD